MLVTNAAPRAGFTDANIRNALKYAAGGRVKWSVEWYDPIGDATYQELVYKETSEADWDAGTHNGTKSYPGGLTVWTP